MRRALVVAHPDDESIWFGGLLAAEPGDWTIICCSIPRTDPERAWKFFNACEVLKAKPRLLPFIEVGGPREDLQHLDLIETGRFDEVVTHSMVGEYGHRHHVQINRWLAMVCPGKLLMGCYGKKSGNKRVVLNEHQLGIKMAAIRCYDHTSPSDGKPKWQALLDRYGSEFDLGIETYDRP